MGLGDRFFISMPNFIKIDRMVAEILWRCNFLSKWWPFDILDFEIKTF